MYKIEFCWLLVYNEEKRRQFNPDCDSHYARFVILSFSFYKCNQAGASSFFFLFLFLWAPCVSKMQALFVGNV